MIHRPNGRIRDKDSFGDDPCPPKDTKTLNKPKQDSGGPDS